jgi:hypothetical protein
MSVAGVQLYHRVLIQKTCIVSVAKCRTVYNFIIGIHLYS